MVDVVVVRISDEVYERAKPHATQSAPSNETKQPYRAKNWSGNPTDGADKSEEPNSSHCSERSTCDESPRLLPPSLFLDAE